MSAERRLQLGVGLVAAAVIGYEIGLVRLFSFLQHYHYTFLVVSGAVCGVGLGAALSAVLRVREERLYRHLGYWAGFCGCSMGLGALALAQFPRMPLWMLVGVPGCRLSRRVRCSLSRSARAIGTAKCSTFGIWSARRWVFCGSCRP